MGQLFGQPKFARRRRIPSIAEEAWEGNSLLIKPET
jgi:hypothetical protein